MAPKSSQQFSTRCRGMVAHVTKSRHGKKKTNTNNKIISDKEIMFGSNSDPFIMLINTRNDDINNRNPIRVAQNLDKL
jgi:hypothetical protein